MNLSIDSSLRPPPLIRREGVEKLAALDVGADIRARSALQHARSDASQLRVNQRYTLHTWPVGLSLRCDRSLPSGHNLLAELDVLEGARNEDNGVNTTIGDWDGVLVLGLLFVQD